MGNEPDTVKNFLNSINGIFSLIMHSSPVDYDKKDFYIPLGYFLKRPNSFLNSTKSNICPFTAEYNSLTSSLLLNSYTLLS